VNDDGELVHLALMAKEESIDFSEAMNSKTWRKAMKEEIQAIKKNQTVEFMNLPLGKQPIAVKWVFKVKLFVDGSISRYKTRLVAKCFLQKVGVDFHDVFAPVARLEIIRLVITSVAQRVGRFFS